MHTEDVWREFVGQDTPEAFLRRVGAREPQAAVDAYMERVPSVYGITLRKTWNHTFSQPEPISKSFVRFQLIAHLEATQEDWQAAVQDLPLKPVPRIVPVRRVEPEPAEDMDAQDFAEDTDVLPEEPLEAQSFDEPPSQAVDAFSDDAALVEDAYEGESQAEGVVALPQEEADPPTEDPAVSPEHLAG